MHLAATLTALSGLALVNAQAPVVPGTTGKLGNAAITTNNPLGVSYTATLPDSDTTGVRGFVKATTNSNGTGVAFQVSLSGFPDPSLGPFRKPFNYSGLILFKIHAHMLTTVYHIHDQPVPADGNCTATLAHVDPYIRGEIPPCDPTQPETCQVGDLAGKHGNITASPFSAAYVSTPSLGIFVH